jgi:hypothetical protein
MLRTLIHYWKTTFPRLLAGTTLAELARAVEGCRSALDLGCGGGSPSRHLGIPYLSGLDGHAPSLREARANSTHQEYHLGDVRSIGGLFSQGQFEACIALDLIEHLTKDEGRQLLRDMETIASKRVIVFTPNGFLPQHGSEDDLQEHLSGWNPEEMQAIGYRVIGMHGPKFLRGEYHRSRFLPRAIAGPLSIIGHFLYTRSHPEKASALLCVKDVGDHMR